MAPVIVTGAAASMVTRDTPIIDLSELDFGSDAGNNLSGADASDKTFEIQLAPEDTRPLLVFLIPGIRSDGLWANNFAAYSDSVISRKIIPVIVRASTDLTSFDLVLRYRMQSLRAEYAAQISEVVEGVADCDVGFICHSMGSSIFADLCWRDDFILPFNSNGNRVIGVIFMGSVCRKWHYRRLEELGSVFVNEVGLKDKWPFWASVTNPFKYDSVGRLGFVIGQVKDRFFPGYHHGSYTTEQHISEWVLPILEEGRFIPRPAQGGIGHNRLRYGRRLAWLVAFALMMTALYCL